MTITAPTATIKIVISTEITLVTVAVVGAGQMLQEKPEIFEYLWFVSDSF
jgi:hypothetical protein